nr:protein IWS1 homolog [Aegilops tauschii subsp. strangulata]
MDLLEVFLSRRIQPLQARDHPMWMYSGTEDTARVHPEEVTGETVAQWLRSITGNKDNPRGSWRVLPFDANNEPDKIYTEMYSMPNGEQVQEGMESGGESGDWKSDDESDEDREDSSSSEEVDSPPRSERRSKQMHDPVGGREKAAKQPKVVPPKPRKALPKIKVDVPVASAAATSGMSMDIDKRQDEEETADAATSRAAPPNVIELPDNDDHEDEPQKNTGRKGRTSSRRVPASKLHASDPLAAPTVPPTPLFVTHSAAKEAIRQASLMMEQMKAVHEASKAAYDASSALQTNVQLNLDLELAKENLQKAKDEVAAMGVGKLEEENAKLKTAIDEANKEVVQLKKDKVALTDKVGDLTQKRDELEDYLGGLAKKMFLMLEEFFQNFEEESWRIETNLDPINSPVKDKAMMNVLRLEARLASIMDYLARLKVAAWKKSSACCGADVTLSLVRVHCKEVREEKLAALKVANTKKLQFQSFMETFIDADSRIADGIDLDEFVEPASPPPAE